MKTLQEWPRVTYNIITYTYFIRVGIPEWLYLYVAAAAFLNEPFFIRSL